MGARQVALIGCISLVAPGCSISRLGSDSADTVEDDGLGGSADAAPGAPDGGPPAGGDDGDGDGDQPGPCSLGPFGPPTPVARPSSDSDEYGPSLSSDGLELFFTGDPLPGGDGGEDLAVALRTSVDAPFGPASSLGAINDAGAQAEPEVETDRLTLYYDDDQNGDYRIHSTTRATVEQGFPAGAPLVALGGLASSYGASLTGDALELFFTSDEGGTRLWVARRAAAGQAFGAPTPVAELDAGDMLGYPGVSHDGLELFYVRGPVDGDGDDIWVARRPDRVSPFGAPTAVAEVNSALSDFDPELSADGTALYLGSNRDGSADELYVAVRACR